MRHADLHETDPRLPAAFVGALVAILLLVAAFVSTPAAAAAPVADPPACVVSAPLQR